MIFIVHGVPVSCQLVDSVDNNGTYNRFRVLFDSHILVVSASGGYSLSYVSIGS